MAVQETSNGRIEYLKQLAEAGFDDVHTLRRETAERVLTEQRMNLIEEISNSNVSSVRELARRTDRNVSIVSRDLDVLYEAGVIDFEEAGRSKRPVLAHENIFVNPVVFGGDALTEDD
jgi:predicted transcriptional regulator